MPGCSHGQALLLQLGHLAGAEPTPPPRVSLQRVPSLGPGPSLLEICPTRPGLLARLEAHCVPLGVPRLLPLLSSQRHVPFNLPEWALGPLCCQLTSNSHAWERRLAP